MPHPYHKKRRADAAAPAFSEASFGLGMQVNVRDNNVDHALRELKRKMLREGVWRAAKDQKFYKSPGEKIREKKKRARKRHFKQLERTFRTEDGVSLAEARELGLSVPPSKKGRGRSPR